MVESYLIESWENVIGELYLSNGCSSRIRNTYAKTSNALFTQRCVEHSILPVFFLMKKKIYLGELMCNFLPSNRIHLQIHCATKDSSESDILAE